MPVYKASVRKIYKLSRVVIKDASITIEAESSFEALNQLKVAEAEGMIDVVAKYVVRDPQHPTIKDDPYYCLGVSCDPLPAGTVPDLFRTDRDQPHVASIALEPP